MVKEVSSQSQFNSEISGPQLTVVDFFANWCGPCKQIAPFIEQLAVKYPQVKFLKVDVDKCQDIAQTYRITAMPTFLFMKNGQQVDMQRGADPGGLEAKVIAHKVDAVNPFAGKGQSLSSGATAGNAREARLAAFGSIETSKASSTSAGTSGASASKSLNAAIAAVDDDEDEALAKAIALSIAGEEAAPSKPSETSDNTKSLLLPGDEKEDDLVPVPVNMDILSQIIDMGFSDVRGRKAIIHGQSLEGALAWLEEHESDPDIDQPYLVKKEDADRRDASGNLKPLSEEEKAQKIKELHEKAKRIREEKARKQKEDEIIREKERRERGKKIDTISEEREKILKKHEMAKAKKEKEDAKKEKERLLAEIARDKEIRKKNAGVLPSVLGVDGYNPSAIKYDQKSEPVVSDAAPTATITQTAVAAPVKKTAEEPVAKKQAVAKPITVDTSIPPEKRIDTAIGLIMKYRLGGDGGNALRLLITFLKNIAEHPDDPKYRSINTEGNAFKTKLSPLVGPLNLLLSVGFEKVNDEGVDKLKYNHQPVENLLVSTLTKLIEAEEQYRRMN